MLLIYKEASLCFNELNFPLERPFNSGNLLTFTKRIPITSLAPGDYKLTMRVLMQGKYVNDYHYSPGKEIFIKKLPEIYFNKQQPVYPFLQIINKKEENKNKLVISNIDMDLIETEYNTKALDLDSVFNIDTTEHFKDSLEFLRNMDEGYEVFIIVKDVDNSLTTTFRSDNFKKFLIPLEECKNKTRETATLYLYRPEKN